MIRLFLETATDVCSVAVADGLRILGEHTAAEPHLHSSHLTLFIRRVMDAAGLRMNDLEEVILSDGPGSYTSLRVGAATAKGLCLALPELQLRVVPTLLSLAAASAATGCVLATINSRRGEVFGQLFRKNQAGARPQVQSELAPQPPEGEQQGGIIALSEPLNVRLTEERWLAELLAATGGEAFTVVGSGAERLLAALPEDVSLERSGPNRCEASCLVIALNKTGVAPAAAPRPVDPASYEPFYLNPPFVTKSKKKPLG